jgi:hypothetical protein
MKNTMLRFKTAQDLWKFKVSINCNVAEINFRDNTLLCCFKATEIKLAIEAFGANHVTVISATLLDEKSLQTEGTAGGIGI